MTALLIDASNVIYRAYYGRAGGRADAVPQVLRNLIYRWKAAFQAEHTLAALDSDTNFRKALYPDYKRGRTPAPPDLEALLHDAANLMQAAGAIPAHAPDFEADDVLGTLAHRAPGGAVIVTGDGDLYGVVNDRVQVYDPRLKALITAADVVAKYGVAPERLPLWKSLRGDSTDNIPGVHGLGEKAASLIAAQCATIDEVFAQVLRFAPKHQKCLRAANIDEIRLYHTLATVRLDAPVVRVRRTGARQSPQAGC